MFVVVAMGFYYFTGPVLFSTIQIKNFLTFGVEMAIIAMGVTMLMIAGEFDLSVGSLFALAATGSFILINMGLGPWVALVVMLGICALIGAFHGVMTIKTRIPSFIVTLAGLMIWRAAVFVITGGNPPPVPKEAVEVLRGVLASPLPGGLFLSSFLIFVALFVILWLVLERTPFGNRVFATGGDFEAARARGARPQRVKLILFIVSAVLAGFAGILMCVRIGSATPTVGTGYELEIIAAAVIGGASLRGGRGALEGAVFGAILLRVIRNGIVLAGGPGEYYRAIVGAVILVAVVFNEFFREKVVRKFT